MFGKTNGAEVAQEQEPKTDFTGDETATPSESGDDTMRPREEDRLETALVALAQATTASVQRGDKLEAAIAALSQRSETTKWTQWLPVVVTCAVILVSGVRWSSVTEGDLRQEVALLKKEAADAQKAAADAVVRVQMLEQYNHNTRVQFALNGWSIDPQSGVITRNRKGR